MKRSKPLQRTTRLRASGPIRAKKRSAAETQRVYGSDERISWLKQQPCVVMGCGRGPCEVAHTENGGVGRKADACHTIPLCPTHHRESHVVGVQTFSRLHHLDLTALAAHTERQWQRHQSAPVPLSRIVPGVVRAIVEGGE